MINTYDNINIAVIKLSSKTCIECGEVEKSFEETIGRPCIILELSALESQSIPSLPRTGVHYLMID